MVLAGVCGLAATATAQVHVGDHGAFPDDGVNDIPGIRLAIAALPPAGGTLTFDPGVYDLRPSQTVGTWPPGSLEHIFEVNQKADLRIFGNGATLLCHDFDVTRPHLANWYNLFKFWRCDALIVQDLTVDMARPPFTFGTCTVINTTLPIRNRYFRLDIAPEFLSPPLPTNMTIGALFNYDQATPGAPMFAQGRVFFYHDSTGAEFSATNPSGSLFDIKGVVNQLKPKLPGYRMMNELSPPAYGSLQVGNPVAIVHQFNGYIVCLLEDSEGILLSNITVHAWPGQVVNTVFAKDVTLDAIQVIPNGNWPMTLTGCALHVGHVAGELQITNCHLEGMLDDGLNIFSEMHDAAATVTPMDSYIDIANCSCIFTVGETWELYGINLLPLATHILTAATQQGSSTRLDLSPPIQTPSQVKFACNVTRYPSSTSITGCTVANNRRSGMLVHRDTTISGCGFYDVTGACVRVAQQVVSFKDGPSCRNVVIDGCTFDSACRGESFQEFGEGAVTVFSAIPDMNGDFAIASLGGVSNVTVKNCVFDRLGGCAVSARSCDKITIDNNTFGGISQLWPVVGKLPLRGLFPQFAAESLVYFRECKDITITNNAATFGLYAWPDRTKPTNYGFYLKTGNAGF